MKRNEVKDSTLRPIQLESPAAELPTGCWLVAARWGYTHHGIYVGDGRVVHYAGLSRGWRTGPVESVSFDEFSLGKSLWTKWTPTARYAGVAAAERALSRLGEDKYRIMTNNCEHFCAWCLDGKGRSRQVEQWFAWPRAMSLAIVAWLVQVLAIPGLFPAMKRPLGPLAGLSPNHRIA